MWAFEHAGIVPDVVVVAKAIANGLPLSAIVSSRELQERWGRGAHGSTYGGNPVACAAGLAVLETIRDEGLVENAVARGAELTRRPRARSPPRTTGSATSAGPGLMVGVEFVRDRRPASPTASCRIGSWRRAPTPACCVLTCGSQPRDRPLDPAARRHRGRDRRGGRDLRGDARPGLTRRVGRRGGIPASIRIASRTNRARPGLDPLVGRPRTAGRPRTCRRASRASPSSTGRDRGVDLQPVALDERLDLGGRRGAAPAARAAPRPAPDGLALGLDRLPIVLGVASGPARRLGVERP